MSGSRVLVSFDGSARACGVLADAVAETQASGGRLTVVALAAVETPMRCCNTQTTFWNQEMRRLAYESMGLARSLVDPALDTEFVVRDGSGRRDLVAIATELGCDVIVEPGRRGRSRRTTAAPTPTRRLSLPRT